MQRFKFSFIDGPLPSRYMEEEVSCGSEDEHCGAHSLFLGQVRADTIDKKKVSFIEFTAHTQMAEQQMTLIYHEIKKKYDVNFISVYHSLGKIGVGQICLMVIVGSGHRKESMFVCEYLLERIKKEVPIWGKEFFEDFSHQWKINKF